MRKRYLYLYPLLIVASVMGLLYTATPKAHAALAGEENGPIIYIDNPDSQDPNSVLTSQADGTPNDLPAATSTDLITAATISDPTTSNNYDIVYATVTPVTEDPPTVDCGLTNPVSTCAVLNKVTVDNNGLPIPTINEPFVLETLLVDGDDDDRGTNNWVPSLSYSPDGKLVLLTQFAFNNSTEDDASALLIFNSVTNKVGTPIVSSNNFNYCLNGGYAQNGAIYYTSCPGELGGSLYYVAPGETEGTPLVLQGDFVPKYPFFIDVSPDSSQILIANFGMDDCIYNLIVLYSNVGSAGNCDYYYVSTLDGTSKLISQLSYNSTYKIEEDFVPTFFSPDGKFIIGTVYPVDNFTFGKSSVDKTIPYTAAFSRTNFSLTALTNTIGVQEWAPAIAVAPSIATTVLPTLPSTGANSNVIFALALILIALGASTLVKAKQNN